MLKTIDNELLYLLPPLLIPYYLELEEQPEKLKQIEKWISQAKDKETDRNQKPLLLFSHVLNDVQLLELRQKGFHKLVAIETPAKSIVLYWPVMVVSTKEAE